ncbi:LLM class flavin-dependent oxidoreductase [Rhodoplanes roseus]|nr:LLM class flavin-dependent oxidoreductase [Rhodoplanes roseus]
MTLGVFFDGFSSTAEMLEVAAAAEEAGAASLWFAQHMGYRDALVWAALAAGATRRVTLVPTAITPYLWPPLPVAMSMATLSEAAGGRVALAVSIGNLLNLDQSGVEPVRPVRVIRDYVETLRALQAGETVRHEGVVHTLRGAAMRFAEQDSYPLYVASTGPQMLGLAGEIGDGVLLSAGLTLASCRRCIDHAEAGARKAGRDPAAVRKAAFINVAVSEDGASARAAMLRKLAFLFRSRGHADNIASSGLDIDHQAIIDHLSRHDLDAATRLLPDAAAQAFAVAGTPAECRDRLAEYLAIGLDEPIIEVTGSREERTLALDLIRQLAKEGA